MNSAVEVVGVGRGGDRRGTEIGMTTRSIAPNRSSRVTMMLAGLMSRWTILCWWAWSSPSAIRALMTAISLIVGASSSRLMPSMKSIVHQNFALDPVLCVDGDDAGVAKSRDGAGHREETLIEVGIVDPCIVVDQLEGDTDMLVRVIGQIYLTHSCRRRALETMVYPRSLEPGGSTGHVLPQTCHPPSHRGVLTGEPQCSEASKYGPSVDAWHGRVTLRKHSPVVLGLSVAPNAPNPSVLRAVVGNCSGEARGCSSDRSILICGTGPGVSRLPHLNIDSRCADDRPRMLEVPGSVRYFCVGRALLP